MNTRRFGVALVATLMFAGGGGPLQAAGLPADMAQLLPAQPAAIFTLSSLDEAEREWHDLSTALGDEGEPAQTLVGILADMVPGFDEVVDRDRPLALSLDATPLLMGGQPGFILVFPVAGDLARLDYLAEGSPFTGLHQQDDYAVLFTQPDYVPPAEPCRVDLLPGIVSASIEIRNTLGGLLPFTDMALAGLAQGRPDSTGAIGEPVMTTDEVAALSQTLRDLVEAIVSFDFAVRREGDYLVAADRLTVTPDGPLAPGPQPAFDAAIDLTRRLPGGGDLVLATALDYRKPFAVIRPFYLANVRQSLREMAPDAADAYQGWIEDHLQLIPWTAHPLAAGVALGDAGVTVHLMLQAPDAEAIFTGVTGLLDRLGELPAPIKLTAAAERRVGGVDVRTYDLDLETPVASDVEGGAVTTAELEHVRTVLARLTGQLNLARIDDLVILCADDDPDALAHLIASAASPRGDVDARLRPAARRGAPPVQQVTVGNLGAFLRWSFETAAELDTEIDRAELEAFGTVPCEMTTGLGSDSYSGSIAVRSDDLWRLAETLRRIEGRMESGTGDSRPGTEPHRP